MSDLRSLLKASLRLDEGTRAKPYLDPVGKITIGVGRNLTDVGLSSDEIELLLDNDINRALVAAERVVGKEAFASLSIVRQMVLVNLAFNLGEGGLAGFRRFLSAVRAGDWVSAAAHLKDSRWATQVGNRCPRLCAALIEDQYEPS